MGWYAIAVKTNASPGSRFTVRKTKNPKIPGGRYAFGPYGSKAKACQVGSYQDYGRPPEGCPGHR